MWPKHIHALCEAAASGRQLASYPGLPSSCEGRPGYEVWEAAASGRQLLVGGSCWWEGRSGRQESC